MTATTTDTRNEVPIRPRDRDGSLRRAELRQQRIEPDSLLWKYFGDRRINLLVGRAGTTENMYPQLGQAVADHSVIFGDLAARIQRSLPQIARTIYGEEPEKAALKIRNYHKPLHGNVSAPGKYEGTRYRGLDPETYYWAHATFLDIVYAGVERFIKPLSPEEKEQLFQESRTWFSLYGVDDSAQPETYTEFQEYWDRTVREELTGETKVAHYTVGYITKGVTRAFKRPPSVPAPVWKHALAPAIDAYAAFLGAGGLDPEMREKLGIPWSLRQNLAYDLFCTGMRTVAPAWERLAPLEWRYVPPGGQGLPPYRHRPAPGPGFVECLMKIVADSVSPRFTTARSSDLS